MSSKIEEIANKDKELRDYALESLNEILPNHPAEAEAIVNLISATVHTIAGLVGHSSKAQLVLTVGNTVMINTGINVAKGDDYKKALVEGIVGALATAGTAAALTAFASSLAVSGGVALV